ncbi:hypothetical protein GGR57DRAFT_497991 [Xylariaceae sp. FL1272]|nr:hypothetical protein GGR57DRAFT_497991 [Xylariaceae sp. FL1272]
MPNLCKTGGTRPSHHCPRASKGNCIRHPKEAYCTTHQTVCSKHEPDFFAHLKDEPCRKCLNKEEAPKLKLAKQQQKAKEKALDEAFRAKQMAPKPGQKGYRKASGKENDIPETDKNTDKNTDKKKKRSEN